MRKPGFEPGSSAWKAPILTTRLFTHAYLPINLNLLKGLHEIILETVDCRVHSRETDRLRIVLIQSYLILLLINLYLIIL